VNQKITDEKMRKERRSGNGENGLFSRMKRTLAYITSTANIIKNRTVCIFFSFFFKDLRYKYIIP